MFEREHHRRIARVLQALDGPLLSSHGCLFGGGTAIALRHGDVVQLGSPLKGQAPELRYQHPRSALEQAGHLLGLSALTLPCAAPMTGLMMVAGPNAEDLLLSSGQAAELVIA